MTSPHCPRPRCRPWPDRLRPPQGRPASGGRWPLGRARAAAALALLASPGWAAPPSCAGRSPVAEAVQEEELEALLAEERRAADRLRRRGETAEALALLDELLAEDPSDAATRALRARCRWGIESPDEVLADARRAFDHALESGPGGSARVLGDCARSLAGMLTELGRADEALAVLERAGGAIDPRRDPRDAWALGRALEEAGRREEALGAYGRGTEAARGGGRGGDDWRDFLARGRCERRLGRYTAASIHLVRADSLALEEGSAEPDVLAELAALYFEVDGEVDVDVPDARRPGVKYNEAEALHETHEATLLGLVELGRFNWRRRSRPPGAILEELLTARPYSVGGHLAAVSMALDDGHLPRARHFLAALGEFAPNRRAVRSERAALAWIEHRRADARALLAELAEEDPHDARPGLVVGQHLLELYRFGEARPFLEEAAERDPDDPAVWTQLGRALANSGDEERGLEALERATELAGGRGNAWRHNTRLVLQRVLDLYRADEHGAHTYLWEPAAADVLATYAVPFYAEARAELAARYGFTPGDVRIEFFGRHVDFSVRSTGFPGFPALGVCFGPVVTAVSPVAELRGSFSWARTAYHEYTHVIHLGLSHNRCPRWITEGIATWEEVRRNPSWSRNMRRDLVDARANGELIPVRELNAAFRGDRILFGYYQGGLLVEMLVRDHGFAPMIRLLEAFDRGLDLDEAFDEVFGRTPEEVDGRFRRFVDEKLSGLAIEPRWSEARAAALRFELGRTPPEEDAAGAGWAEGWCTVAWQAWQERRRVDAEEALRRAETAGPLPARGSFLRGEIAFARERFEDARAALEAGLEAGGEAFRARVLLGTLAVRDGDREAAERHLLAAEEAFPGFPQLELSAELALVRLYEEDERSEDAMAARERWLHYNAGDFAVRLKVADWHYEAERYEPAARLYAEANEVDPFHTGLHERWGRSAYRLGRWAVAERELDVALRIPAEHDADPEGAPAGEARAETLDLRAQALVELGRVEEAREAASAESQ